MFEVTCSASPPFVGYVSTGTESYTMIQPATFTADTVKEFIQNIHSTLRGVGIVGNFLCFVTLVFSSLRRTSTCIYMAAIAVLDTLILVLDFCVLLRGYLGETRFYLQSNWSCGVQYFLFYFSIHFDVLLLIAMTFDRYIALRKSRQFSQQFTHRRRHLQGGRSISWSQDLRAEVERGASESSMHTIDSDINIIINSPGEMTVATPGNGATYSLASPSPMTPTARTKVSNAGSVRMARNTNITVMLLLVSLTFLLLTSPVVIVLLYKRYYWLPTRDEEKAKVRLVHAFVDNLMYTNHAVNFLLYCISGRRFRMEFKRTVTRFCSCRLLVKRHKN
ncbi:uncharacterized protein LOC112560385 [Pomacea canaliculata]|uniref:uncharacterized protein LOC112560385 n=1 Tax=Pomacea canaliculata TaxID=400727 RepID=UPI000D7325CE|nr:uncharacterized protein LOC112560385 [Pomacea canaliculata]